MRSIIYDNLESLTEKINEYANNTKKCLTTKIGEHFPCGLFLQQFRHLIT